MRGVSRKGSESGGLWAPACARVEGVSTLGELPFRAGNNGMRVSSPVVSSLAAWRFAAPAAAPLQTDVEKTGGRGFFPSFG